MSGVRCPAVLLSIAALASAGCGGDAGNAPARVERASSRTAAPTQVADGHWPQWRGTYRDGVSRETGLLAEWPAGGPPLVWKSANAGMSYSSVAVAGDGVYTLGARGEHEYAIGLNRETGLREWVRQIGPEFDNDRGTGSRSTPTVVGDVLYVLGATGQLWALKTDGEPVWHVDLEKRFGTETLRWGISESPLVDGDLVIVATGSPEGSIVAFNRHNADVVWQSKGLTDQPSYASAIVADVDGVRQVIHVTDAAAVGVRISDGLPMWRYEKVANDTANCTTPIYRDGYVFVSSAYDTGGALLKLTSSDGTTSAEEVYFTRDMMNHHGGVVLVGDTLYGFSNKILTAIDFMTGEELWRHRSVGKGSLTAADGKLYVLSERGDVALVEAAREDYRPISMFSNRSKHKTWAHPVIAGGRLYIRVRDYIFSYDLEA